MDMPGLDTIKGKFLRDGAVGILPSALVHIAAAVEDGETITIGADVYEFDTDADVTTGNILVDCTGGSEVAAEGTFTVASGQNAAADDTVTIGSTVYTFVAVPAAAYDVDIGTDDDGSAANLEAAINAGAGAGTAYHEDTVAHPDVTAVATANDVVVTANVPGTAGNSIASTETGAQLSWDATTLGTTTAGVDPTAGEATDALITAINASSTETITAVDLATGDILLLADAVTEHEIVVSETMAGANNVAETPVGGGMLTTLSRAYTVAIVPTATQVLTGIICIPLEFEPTGALVQIRATADGTALAWDGKVTIDTTNYLLKIDNTGSADWDADDTISVLVF